MNKEVFEEEQKGLLEEPKVLGEKNNVQMYLADKSRWENMKSYPKETNDEAKLTDLSEKYQRLLKAKEASESLDKNAELVTLKTKCFDDIRKLKDEFKKETNRNEGLRPNEDTESNLTVLNTLKSLKNQGHTRTSPASHPNKVHPCKVCKTIFSNN